MTELHSSCTRDQVLASLAATFCLSISPHRRARDTVWNLLAAAVTALERSTATSPVAITRYLHVAGNSVRSRGSVRGFVFEAEIAEAESGGVDIHYTLTPNWVPSTIAAVVAIGAYAVATLLGLVFFRGARPLPNEIILIIPAILAVDLCVTALWRRTDF